MTDSTKGLGWVEKLLALWIFLCIVIGLAIGKYFPEFSQHLAIGIPIGLFLMIYPAMTKIELGELKDAFKSKKAGCDHRFFQLRCQSLPALHSSDGYSLRRSCWA